jgi:hypothetical protein
MLYVFPYKLSNLFIIIVIIIIITDIYNNKNIILMYYSFMFSEVGYQGKQVRLLYSSSVSTNMYIYNTPRTNPRNNILL